MSTHIRHMVPWAHPSLHPKWHLYWLSRFCTVKSPITLQWSLYFPPKIAPSPYGIGSPSNIWYLWPTQVITPNGILIGSAVFVWVANAILYKELSMEKKTPKIVPPLRFHHRARGGSSHIHRQHAPKIW